MCVAYITQSLDKGTLGSSSIMGWQADVGAVGQDYALTSTFLYVGIIAGEPLVSEFLENATDDVLGQSTDSTSTSGKDLGYLHDRLVCCESHLTPCGSVLTHPSCFSVSRSLCKLLQFLFSGLCSVSSSLVSILVWWLVSRLTLN